ncbi:SOS response-associated peptidase [Microbacterium sp. NPDC055988]|uniref:SOS response-associated peptidase n=1 Tax=Microbacterium sp. NPDC055988 TaxID=3345671 RepID=UPI0035DAF825
MCGRFAMDDRVNSEITEFVTRTGRRPDEWAPDWESAFNIAPTEDIPILLDSAKTGELRFERARWSLVPAWSPTLKLKFPTFNARAEGMAEKSTWRKPLQTHRAIVLARGFYEWTGERGHKTPWFMSDPDGALLGFAGLYSWWPDPTKDADNPDRWTLTATIITSDSVKTLAGIHDRNPVILPEDLWLHWIDPTISGDQDLVDEAVRAGVTKAEQLRIDQVQPFTSKDDGLHLIEAIDAQSS